MAEKEYIERKDLINNRPPQRNPDQTGKEEYNNGYNDGIKAVLSCIEIQPSADVEPVRHGQIIWKRRRRGGFRHAKCLHRFCNFVIEDNAPCKHIAKIDERYTIDEPYCSECGKLLGDFLNYCGNCGAKMDGKDSEEND